jgi:hypothetical protein
MRVRVWFERFKTEAFSVQVVQANHEFPNPSISKSPHMLEIPASDPCPISANISSAHSPLGFLAVKLMAPA